MTAEARFLRGSKAIAKALGCSDRTVRRMAKDGRLPAFKTGAGTSPLRVERKALAQMRREDER